MSVKICIDPGHGGHDPGAVGPTGLTEASVALAISLKLSDNLNAIGVDTLMTRSTDVFIELGTRCKIANDWKADYFVSVHLNSNGSSAVGIETLYKTNNGKALASPIQESMIVATGDTDRGLKQRTDLYVLNGTNMPAALAEVGFISNPGFEAKFRTDDYRQLVADAIAAGLADFLHLLSVPAPIPPAPSDLIVTITIDAPTGVTVKINNPVSGAL
jgi:N-acetylmuramoyl-L-alanine amidase